MSIKTDKLMRIRKYFDENKDIEVAESIERLLWRICLDFLVDEEVVGADYELHTDVYRLKEFMDILQDKD